VCQWKQDYKVIKKQEEAHVAARTRGDSSEGNWNKGISVEKQAIQSKFSKILEQYNHSANLE
jgi:hypothetical protein